MSVNIHSLPSGHQNIPHSSVVALDPIDCRTRKTASCAFDKFHKTVGRQVASLAHRVIQWILQAAAWVKVIILKILGWFKGVNPPQKTTDDLKATPQSRAALSSQPLGGTHLSLPYDLRVAPTQPRVTPYRKNPAQSDRQLLWRNDPSQSLLRLSPASLIKVPSFTFFLGSHTQIIVDNPFGKGKVPSDDEVYQFRMNLHKVHSEISGQEVVLEAGGNYLAIASPQESKSLSLGLPQVTAPLNGIVDTLISLSLPQAPSLSMAASMVDEDDFPLVEPDNYHESGRNLFLGYLMEDAKLYTESVPNLECAITYCVRLSEEEGILCSSKIEKIRRFFDKLKAVNLQENKPDYPLLMGGNIPFQRILCPRLDDLLKIPFPTCEQLLEIKLVKAELATSLGHGIVSANGGKNGAVFIKTLENQAVGVFKTPEKFEKIGWTDLAIQYFKKMFGQARLLNATEYAQEYAEVVASDLCDALHFEGIAPKAIMTRFCGKKGAFISFLDGFIELKDVKQQFNARSSFSKEEIAIWQKMVVWNFLIGNLDPHDENIFVQMDEEGILSDLKMIDHGNCFPLYNPGMGSAGNLGAWGHFSISREPFLEEIKAFILENITEQNCVAFLNGSTERAAFFKDSMKKLQIERVRVLRECVATNKIHSPALLARIKTDSSFQACLKKYY